MNNLTRRDFVKTSAIYAFAVTAFGSVSCKPDEKSPVADPDCDATTTDILGPFYRPGAPPRDDLSVAGQSGSPLLIKGVVYDKTCKPLKEALVEVWHSDTEGNYDNTSSDFRYRGSYQTEKEGKYQFNTIIPGRYLNGNTFRPSHVHFRITAPQHKELVSQIYFKDDPYIASDPWASNPKAKLRILPLEESTSGLQTVTFDIYLI